VALEPRPYQLVPLLMALKQEVSRVLIADEVGLGKTVEALLIARELLDRGEIRKVTVICPPHLCEKWKSDMIRQFNLAAEVVRPGTAQKLERGLPAGKSIFDVVPFTVVSLDWIKSDRNREGFLRSCGEFVIVDEAHTCAARKGGGRQQRYELLRGLAADPQRHLVLLTATPHSGDQEAFDNLLGLLDPKFESLSEMPEGQRRKDLRDELGNYFVQRRRLDLKEEWGTEGADFPDRETREATYTLSGDWGKLFDDVLAYARELVERSVGESKLRQRMSWWAALALLRCVSSSPAAASASLRTKLFNLQNGADAAAAPSEDDLADDLEAMATLAVLDGAEEEFSAEEAAPGADLADSADAGLLRDLIERSDRLRGKAHDPKFKQLLKELKGLLAEGFRPVIFCRFRPTAHYLAEQLQEELPKRAHVVMAVTGDLPPEERVERIRELQNELANGKVPVLVATDCLSEGIDLQHTFDAVVHYDLCWNPTRHEQREGRVDRFGQARSAVRALMLHGGDSNPVDERVRTVILEKEKTIRKELGVSVPIPGNANTITQAVLGGIFGKAAKAIQGFLNLGLPGFGGSGSDLDAVLDAEWQSAKENAKATRTIFAKRSLKPEEALREWNRTRESLGSADAVERLVLMSSDIRFWSSGDTKTGPPDGLLMGVLRRPFDRCFIGGCRVVVVGCGTGAAWSGFPSDLLGWRRWRYAADARRGGAARLRAEQAAAPLLPQPVAVAPDRQHVAVVQQPIEDRRGDHLIAKHLAPLHDGAVGGDQHAAALVAAGDQLEEQVRRVRLQRQVAQLINDQQPRLGVLRQPGLQGMLRLGLGQRGDQLHGADVLDAMAQPHRLAAQCNRQVGLAHARRSQQQQGVAIGHPAAGRQLTDLGRIDRRLGLEIERLQRAHIREASQPQRHLHPQLVLAGHLGRAQPGQGLPQVHLPSGRLLQQRIKAITDRRQPQAGEHGLQLLGRHRWCTRCGSVARVGGTHAATSPATSA
jgi:superfamily II DNA or RNA helicase